VTDDLIDKDLERSGAYDEKNHGMVDGSNYLYDHSNATMNDGKTDFLISSEIVYQQPGMGGLPGQYLYLTVSGDKIIGQNNYNMGNFMWGAAAGALGLPEWLARAGAHANNYMNDPGNDNKSWYKKDFDSPDDQKSIKYGLEKWKIIQYKKGK
ncbi:MAG TPA: polymorphic toxin type 44 domain-containing protein, partial [Bacteroidia bacterium]|nr:polymorphic toxin type 44 domain-containing protein [Bacteroidia bacterium]